MLNVSADFARMHFTTRRPKTGETPGILALAMRPRIDGARLLSVSQVGLDRMVRLEFERADERYALVAELMGKHSNLMFLDQDGRILAAAKWIGRSKSSRVIQAGMRYEPPPFVRKPNLLLAKPGEDLLGFEGGSPFLAKLVAAGGLTLARAQDLLRAEFKRAGPVISPGSGAYPVSVAALGLKEHARPTLSVALEQHFDQEIQRTRLESLRASLLGSLKRVALAREVAISDLTGAIEQGLKAGEAQRKGELLLAFASSVEPGSSLFEAMDYNGSALPIRLDPELSAKENAERFFARAKRAKARLGPAKEQVVRLSNDLEELQALVREIQEAADLEALELLKARALQRRWLMDAPAPTRSKEERPYEGHKIRELLGPGGYKVLYGENATSNDYLTTRVAKPSDWWLHVRGGVSAHVVIPTGKNPEKTPFEALRFAAEVAAKHSPSKHAGLVAVDYTQRKYVRKPRGSAAGFAVYTHEKTIHVETG